MRDVLLPRSLSELWEQLEAHAGASVYAGGTDLLVKMRSGLLRPSSLICLERLPALRGVSETADALRLGSCTTHTQLLEHPAIRRHLPVLTQALRGLGSPLIRNMGTLGGNICTASPAGDTLPPLYALNAELELRSRAGERRMPIREFIRGPGRVELEPGEILAAVWVSKPERYTLHHFEKVGSRNALACSIASFAALLRLSPKGIVEAAALAWGSVAPTVLTCPGAEEALMGRPLSAEALQGAAALVRRAVRPISDVRAEADYRRAVSGNLVLRLMALQGGREATTGCEDGTRGFKTPGASSPWAGRP